MRAAHDPVAVGLALMATESAGPAGAGAIFLEP